MYTFVAQAQYNSVGPLHKMNENISTPVEFLLSVDLKWTLNNENIFF